MKKKGENRTLECFVCHQTFKKKVSNLRRHIQLHYPSVPCFKCLECEKTCQNKSNLKTHWNSAHSVHANTPPRMAIATRKSKSKHEMLNEIAK